jgi:transcriptional regulator with XRE-family HTH domain
MILHKLKHLREERGLSQHELAVALHVGQNTISNIENGKTKIDIELLYKLAEFYKKDPAELLSENYSSVNYHEKVENGFAHIQTINQDNKELITALKYQLTVKDKQIEELMNLLKTKV